MIIYIAGSISNCIDTYKQKFDEAEKYLEELGHIVLNPTMLPRGLRDDSYMPICLAMLSQADAIFIIGDDWENSPGVLLEKSYAEYQDKLVFYDNRENPYL